MTKLDIPSSSWRFLRPNNAANYIRTYKDTSVTRNTLAPATTRRQFATAFEILNRFKSGRRGVLLADDVGLGKTAVAAFVAMVFAGKRKRVRILAPNATMMRRWRQELEAHHRPMMAFAPHLKLGEALRRTREHVHRLHRGIAVSTHLSASQLSCDLLIIDEAHRTRSEKSNLAAAIKQSNRGIGNILVLTATPFSIDPKDLARLLSRIGGHAAAPAVGGFSSILGDLWGGHMSGSPPELAVELATLAKAAVDAIRPFVIRHGIDDLTQREQRLFGIVRDDPDRGDEVPSKLLEAMLRADRALTLGRKSGAWTKTRTNDPRHHVGMHQLERDLGEILDYRGRSTPQGDYAVAHARAAAKLLRSNGRHAKVASTVKQVCEIVATREKVLVFCDHHSSATELAVALASELRWPVPGPVPPRSEWTKAWESLLSDIRLEARSRADKARFNRYLDWLCSPGVRSQVLSWLDASTNPERHDLHQRLASEPARGFIQCAPIADHARDLYRQLTDKESTSTRSVLGNSESRDMPGHGRFRVAAVCDAGHWDKRYPNVFFPNEPDAALAVFNSPFGPDVLVATDRLSEGIDLHKFCRHLIHHELDPSPVRTVQRNGRIRRVNSWAARSNQPIRISYPALRGTRDENLVKIMRYRLQQFDLLLGGVRVEIDPDAESAAPSMTKEILKQASRRLGKLRLGL